MTAKQFVLLAAAGLRLRHPLCSGVSCRIIGIAMGTFIFSIIQLGFIIFSCLALGVSCCNRSSSPQYCKLAFLGGCKCSFNLVIAFVGTAAFSWAIFWAIWVGDSLDLNTGAGTRCGTPDDSYSGVDEVYWDQPCTFTRWNYSHINYSLPYEERSSPEDQPRNYSVPGVMYAYSYSRWDDLWPWHS